MCYVGSKNAKYYKICNIISKILIVYNLRDSSNEIRMFPLKVSTASKYLLGLIAFL